MASFDSFQFHQTNRTLALSSSATVARPGAVEEEATELRRKIAVLRTPTNSAPMLKHGTVLDCDCNHHCSGNITALIEANLWGCHSELTKYLTTKPFLSSVPGCVCFYSSRSLQRAINEHLRRGFTKKWRAIQGALLRYASKTKICDLKFPPSLRYDKSYRLHTQYMYRDCFCCFNVFGIMCRMRPMIRLRPK